MRKVPTPTGRIAYLKGNAAFVAEAGAAGGAPRRLPQSDVAAGVFLSPVDGAALYFAARAAGNLRGFISRPPYREARPLPTGLVTQLMPSVVWSGNGKTVFLTGEKDHAAFEPTTGRLQRLRFPVHSASQDGRVVAFVTEKEIKVGWPGTGQERTLFSVGRPQPLFAALKNARRPDKLSDVTNTDPELWRSSRNWQIGAPALSPDGATVFFATNLGGGMGASANTSFCFFAANVKTGSLSVLSRLGVFFGRVPVECQVSPDGKRLLFLLSQHSSAVENPVFAHVADLLTQQSREILRAEPERKRQANLTDGAAWSPEGRYVAVSNLYYDVATVLRTENWEPRDDDFTLLIKDAATGRTVRRIPGARQPSWSE